MPPMPHVGRRAGRGSAAGAATAFARRGASSVASCAPCRAAAIGREHSSPPRAPSSTAAPAAASAAMRDRGRARAGAGRRPRLAHL
eukprot:scaffold98246_cov53-Phaeocystis_antarctica.AAC.1